MDAWLLAAELVAETRDLLHARPLSGHEDEVVAARGWLGFLEGLDEATLVALEVGGLEAEWPTATPASLRDLIDRLRVACTVPSLEANESRRALGLRESPAKRAQIEAFSRVLAPIAARARRVVDVGSGHGHLTRAIASASRPTVGLERDARLIETARAIPAENAPEFVVRDVLAEGLPIERGDCIIGLHACGELGDRIVDAGAARGAAVVLVGCCLQKRREEVRAPFRRDLGDDVALPRALLGLSNLTTREEGVEASRAENLAARERRLALRLLLREHAPMLRVGAEIEGLNRRVAHADLETLIARAFAVRGLAVPSRERVGAAATEAATLHARSRRIGLPRTLLARLLEVFVLHDRAERLRAAGHVVQVGTLFSQAISARNLVLAATPPRW